MAASPAHTRAAAAPLACSRPSRPSTAAPPAAPPLPPSSPAEALVAGLLVLCMALGCLPLVQRYYPHSQGAKRTLLLATALAALLVLLRPPLPIRGGAECPPGLPLGLCPRLWDAGHVPDHELDDVAVWGEGPGAAGRLGRGLLASRESQAAALLAGARRAGWHTRVHMPRVCPLNPDIMLLLPPCCRSACLQATACAAARTGRCG